MEIDMSYKIPKNFLEELYELDSFIARYR